MSRYACNTQVVLSRPLPIVACHVTIPAGEYGEIIDVDPDDGGLTIKLCKHFRELDDWRSIIYVKPTECERYLQPSTPPRSWRPAQAMAASFALAICMSLGSVSKSGPAVASANTVCRIIGAPVELSPLRLRT